MMLHFIRPSWLLLLIPALIYLLWLIFSFRQANPWKKVCDPHLLQTLIQPAAATSRRFFYCTLFLLYLISIIALAGPAWKKIQLPIYCDISSMLLVLDLSPAMQGTDLKPDRLTRAKFKIRDLINAAQNTQMGLVAFTNEAFVASPLSKDANTLNALIDELQPQMMPVSGSDIAQGLTQGLALLKQAGAERSQLLLITASEPTPESWNVAKTIAQTGNHLNVLALLTPSSTTQTTLANLQQLARVGRGSFYLFTPDNTDIQRILTTHLTKQAIQDENTDKAYVWRDAGPWFCLFLIPFVLIVLREKV